MSKNPKPDEVDLDADQRSLQDEQRNLEKRMQDLESQSRVRFFVEIVLLPLIVAGAGILSAHWIEASKKQIDEAKLSIDQAKTKIDETRASIQRSELEAKRIDTIRATLPELFIEPPDRVLIAEALISPLLDDNVKARIRTAVQARLEARYSDALEKSEANPKSSGQALAAVAEIARTATGLQTPSAQQFRAVIDQPHYVVAVSERSLDSAIFWAKRFISLGYDAKVYKTSNPYLAVVLGVQPLPAAKQLGDLAVQKGHAKEYFVAPQKHIREQVFPTSAMPSATSRSQ